MAVSHSAANMTPSAYMAGTTTPVAITATWSTVPAASAQPCPGRPTSPAITRAAAARAPPVAPAAAGQHARGTEQQARLTGRGRRAGDQNPRAARAGPVGGFVGQRGRGLDRI